MTDHHHAAAVDRDATAVDLVIFAPDHPGTAGLAEAFEHAIVLDAGSRLPEGRAASAGRVLVELSDRTTVGLLAAAAEQTVALGPRWSLVLGKRGAEPVPAAVRELLAAMEGGWEYRRMRLTVELATLELGAIGADRTRRRPEVESSIVGLVEALSAAAGPWAEMVEALGAIARERDRVEGRLRRAEAAAEAGERARSSLNDRVAELSERLDHERTSRERAEENVAEAHRRLVVLEGTKAIRASRRLWRLRARMVARAGDVRARASRRPIA